MDKLQGSVKEQLQNFAQDIQTYISSNKWTNVDIGGEKISCSMTVFFVSASDNNTYTAQLFIGSQRPIFFGKNPSAKKTAMTRIFDDKWEFTYFKNQPLYRNENQFDPLTDMIDYYMYLVLGFDFDSYEPDGGTPYFQKCLTFCNQAPSSAKGWERSTTTYSKFTLAEELLNPKNQPFREGFFLYHFKGLDLLATKPDVAYKNIINLLQRIAELKKSGNPRSLLFKNFFETKYGELADLFKNYSDKNVYQLLIAVDPAHQAQYEEAYKGK